VTEDDWEDEMTSPEPETKREGGREACGRTGVDDILSGAR
jgi:hypothetical protein